MDIAKKIKTRHLTETVFDVIYLLSLLTIAVLVIALKPTNLRIVYGVMLLTLYVGEGFHLVTRIFSFYVKDPLPYVKLMGRARQVSSIAFTVYFAIMLLLNRYFYLNDNSFFFMAGILFGAVRIVVVFFKGNHWSQARSPFVYSLIRNIPLLLMMVLAFIAWLIADYNGNLWLAPEGWIHIFIMLSFFFYSAVVFFAPKNPDFGYFMILLSVCQLGIAVIGLLL